MDTDGLTNDYLQCRRDKGILTDPLVLHSEADLLSLDQVRGSQIRRKKADILLRSIHFLATPESVAHETGVTKEEVITLINQYKSIGLKCLE